jgi:hypothetical protein
MPGQHSSLGASKAHRYRRCPGSIKAEQGLPDNAGEHAAQGTVFHEFAALAVEYGADPLAMVGATHYVEKFGDLPFTHEMAIGMLPGLELIESLLDSPGRRLIVESRVDLSSWLGDGQFGTVDVGIVDIARSRLVTFDWKWGAGVPVSPVENDQAILYTLGLWGAVSTDFEARGIAPEDVEVIIIIEQPRAEGGGGVWTTNMALLLEEGAKIARDAEATRDPNAPRIPGVVQCKFCRAASFGTCKEYARFNADLLGTKFDDLEEQFLAGLPVELHSRRAMTPEQRSQILLHRKMIDKWLDQLHEEAMRDAEAGRPVPGMKLVDGRSARVWRDEAKAEFVLTHAFGEEAFSRKLVSPAQAEEKVGKKAFQRDFGMFVEKQEPKPILVPLDHKRPARMTHGDKYDLIENEETAI